MHLARVELQGFKTFAKKTVLHFPDPKAGRHAITTIVGPNGSGKSNIADAVRWALGEQSLKLLRGKEGEDVIFAGASGKARAGFAEVTAVFNNEDGSVPIDFKEVTITRRLFRDGTSQYLLNEKEVRLQDIQLLLAEAKVGQRSYAIIAQGMVDHILIASPTERKDFFDDATGVKPLQIKRHLADLKLRRTTANLHELQTIIQELEPRLRLLKRQVRRLEQREEIAEELRKIQWQYYGALWSDLIQQEESVRSDLNERQREIETRRAKIQKAEKRFEEIAAMDNQRSVLTDLPRRYRQLQEKRRQLSEQEFALRKKIEIEKTRNQINWTPLPLTQIVEEIRSIHKEHQELNEQLDKNKSNDDRPEKFAAAIRRLLDKISIRISQLLEKLEQPAPEMKADAKQLAELSRLEDGRQTLDKQIQEIEGEMDRQSRALREERTELFETQKDLQNQQNQLYELERTCGERRVELARLEERRVNLSREMNLELKEESKDVKNEKRTVQKENPETLFPEMQRLKYRLELIGAIDEETVREHEETKTRFDFLDGQIKDLLNAVRDLEKVIQELDGKIVAQSEKAFNRINREFQRYFKALFGGGACRLLKVEPEIETMAESPEGTSESEIEADHTVHAHEGIEIQATPPGKKLKALNLLSGGERALTAIALLCSIMATNPSPFVILDEVDAALDEINTVRFATILDELRAHTQFIVISHNRATMERSDVLYGVTMGDDGVSNILSVRFDAH